jgi:hypothetical protein
MPRSWLKVGKLPVTGGGGPIGFTNLGASSGTSQVNPDIRIVTDALTYSNTAWTPPTTGIVAAWASTGLAGGVPTLTLSGNGATWTEIYTMTWSGGARRISLFATFGNTTSNGITTLTCSGAVATLYGFCYFFQITGAHETGAITDAFAQGPNNAGVTQLSGSVTLAAAGNAANRPMACFYHAATEAVTPNGVYTEQDSWQGAGPALGGDAQVKTDAFDTTPSASWVTAANWGGLAAEVVVGP